MPKAKILYIEDEPFLGKIVKESLESRGYAVWMETDGAKVLELYEKSKPDVCVLDVMLPNKDGFSIAEEIRRTDNHTPLIFLTAKTQTQDLVKGFELGGNDYLRKPFSMEELIVRIENLLRMRSQNDMGKQDDYQLGIYRFHPIKQLLHDGVEEKKLSFRESELLKMLVNNGDQVVDRREILKQLWGDDNFFNSRNLDVYINKIRGYLKKDSRLEIITIKGIGYRFISA
jgi:DNA-binding response OmpR family regulator